MITTWASYFRPHDGERHSDRALVERIRHPRTHASKASIGRWSGATFADDYRCNASFEAESGLVLDFDKDASRSFITDAFADLCGLAHTTWAAGRWRVALMLDREIVTVEAHGRVWRVAAIHAERHGLEVDTSAGDACHAFALPARGAAAYDYLELGGALFDVKAALELVPAPQQLPEPERQDPDTYSQRLKRAEACLRKMPGAIAGQVGHATTFKAAVVLVRGFGLDHDDALHLLVTGHNPHCSPPWSVRELRHKVLQAAKHGRLAYGALAERKRERNA